MQAQSPQQPVAGPPLRRFAATFRPVLQALSSTDKYMEITINLPKQFADRMRSYRIKVDGVKVGEIKPGESATIIIPDGASIIQANVDWGLSNELNISEVTPNDTLTVKNTFSHKLWIPLVAFYFATFGRSKYLELSKNA